MHDKQLHDRLHLPGTQLQNFAWNDSILQSKLNENISGRCLSSGATKFFKLVLADKKTKTAT